MSRTKVGLAVDLGFIALLLLGAALPLIRWRGDPWLHTTAFTLGFWAASAALCAAWWWLSARLRAAPAATPLSPGPAPEGPRRFVWGRALLVCALLTALTAVCYWQPLTKLFWGGADEFCNFTEVARSCWSDGFDASFSRPLITTPAVIAKALTPGRIDGFLWVAAFLCLANALLLYGVLRQIWPGAHALPAAAAVLLVVNRADLSRFYVLWTTNFYWTALAFFLLGLWLFLLSLRRGSRRLLTLACLALGAGLLVNEGLFPLAALGLGLVCLVRGARGHRLVWAWAWGGTVALLATRFALYLKALGANSYQMGQAAGAFRNPEVLLTNLRLQLGSALAYFRTTAGAAHGRSALLALALAAALVGLALGKRPARRHGYLLALGLAALATLLGMLPFLHMPTTLRTQFFAAPGQAVLLACGICLAAELLGRWVGVATAAAAVGVLAASGTRESLREQELARAQRGVSFESTVRVFRQIHALAPSLTRDTLVLLVLDEHSPSPLGVNYCTLLLSWSLLGHPTIQTSYNDQAPSRAIFKKETVTARDCGWAQEVGYERVLAFRLSADGSLGLLRHLPAALLPPGHAGARYDPRAVARPGPVRELPYLRYPRWARRPRDLFDLADGVVLGQGWGPLDYSRGAPCRRAAGGAEVAVNPLARARAALRLDVEPEPPGRAGRLEALDDGGRVVASAPLAGRQVVTLQLPADPERIGLYRLRFRAEGASAVGAFRAYCPGGPAGPLPGPKGPPRDIEAEGLWLAGGWRPVERHAGELSRRTMEGAGVVLGVLSTAYPAVTLELEPGPGRDACRLEVRDPAGRVLAEACVKGRQEVRVPVPADVKLGAVLQLFSGRDRVPALADSPPLDVRVFTCRPSD
jgi:hypothetical protein